MADGVVTGTTYIPLPHEAVFDLRDGARTGLGRVARETVAAYRALFPDDPVTVLTEGGGRYSLQAQREWPALRRAHPDAVWVWFHWDVPWVGMPRRSVVYVHDLIHLNPSLGQAGRLKRAVAHRWIGHALRCAGRVVTVSEATARALWVPATVIPNGVSEAFAGPWVPEDYLLVVGDDRPYKNLGVARDVAASLGVPLRHAQGIGDAELRGLYAGARAVLVPSRAEGFGLPVLEAFACGAPVVASDIAALREVSGGLATLVPPGDVAAWTAEVGAELAGQCDVDAMRAAADARRARAAQFTWDAAAIRLRRVLESVNDSNQ